MNERNRCPVHHIHESEVITWHRIGWTYVGPADDSDFAVMQWEHATPPAKPMQDDEFVMLRSAVGALEGRVANG